LENKKNKKNKKIKKIKNYFLVAGEIFLLLTGIGYIYKYIFYKIIFGKDLKNYFGKVFRKG
jgi:hypothetical protein